MEPWILQAGADLKIFICINDTTYAMTFSKTSCDSVHVPLPWKTFLGARRHLTVIQFYSLPLPKIPAKISSKGINTSRWHLFTSVCMTEVMVKGVELILKIFVSFLLCATCPCFNWVFDNNLQYKNTTVKMSFDSTYSREEYTLYE